MITENQLNQYGYTVKNRLITGGSDFIHPEKDYLVSLSNEGEVTIVYHVQAKKNSVNMDTIEEFVNYHNSN